MRRRDFVVGGTVSALARPALANNVYSLRDAAREAWIYTLPLNEVALVRSRVLALGARANRFSPQPALAGPEARAVTTPNNDTIYATGFIDLSQGPVVVTQPDLGDRYASLAFMDMWSDDFAVLGSRTTGPKGGRYTLVGPDHAAGPGALRSPTPWVWALARVVVNGEADLDAARAVQAGYRIDSGASGFKPAPGVRRDGPWETYFAAVSALLVENPPPSTDGAVLDRIAPLALGAGFDPARFGPAERAEIAAGVAEAIQSVRERGLGADARNGWLYQAPDTGGFRQDYLGRARTALGGLAALPPEEAMYLSALSPDGHRIFDGDGAYRLHFAKGQTPPVNAFWSLTMYEATAQGQYFMTPNPINRYAVGDRTPGLTFGPDGSLTLLLSRTDPGGSRSSNWLPAPAHGPWSVLMRLYLPRPEAISRTWTPPRIERA